MSTSCTASEDFFNPNMADFYTISLRPSMERMLCHFSNIVISPEELKMLGLFLQQKLNEGSSVKDLILLRYQEYVKKLGEPEWYWDQLEEDEGSDYVFHSKVFIYPVTFGDEKNDYLSKYSKSLEESLDLQNPDDAVYLAYHIDQYGRRKHIHLANFTKYRSTEREILALMYRPLPELMGLFI